MQSATHKCIFIHIPKCAGTTIRNTLQPLINGHAAHSHCVASSYDKPELKNYFMFSFVRNPWDRFLSAFLYLKAGGACTHFNGADWDDDIIKVLGIDKAATFSEFLRDKKFLKENLFRGQHFVPLCGYLDRDIDFVGKVENLQEDFNLVCNKIGISAPKLPCINKTKTQSSRKHYTSYYSAENAEFVAELYAQDIDKFTYKFK